MDNIQVVDKRCLDRFVENWINFGERTQFMAFLYGRYETREGENGVREIALVYSLFMPKQSFQNGRIILEKDDSLANITAITASLNLQCIGCVFTSPPREDPLTSFDVNFIAPLQLSHKQRSDYSSKFVSVVISRNSKRQIEPTAFMLSDQCMCMQRDGLLLPPLKASHCRSTTQGKNKELLSSVIRNDEKLGSQEVTEFEPLFFLVELTITMAKSSSKPVLFASCTFPDINSKQESKSTLLSKIRRRRIKRRGIGGESEERTQ